MERQEQDALILYWWMRGKSATEVATIVLGNACARNVVIGRVNRARGPAAEAAKAAHSANMPDGPRKRGGAVRPRPVPEYTPIGFNSRTKPPKASAKDLPKIRAKRAAEGRAVIAKVEASAARPNKVAMFGSSKARMMSFEGSLEEMPVLELPPRRYRPTLAVINSAFVAALEKPFDAYAHLRSDRSLHDALAALTRSA